jgi:hypothetical protein
LVYLLLSEFFPQLKVTKKGKIEMTISATLICSTFNGLGIRRNRISECAKKTIPKNVVKKLRSGIYQIDFQIIAFHKMYPILIDILE